MTAADEWRDLARRCREAKGADREIDLALAEALYASGVSPVNYAPEVWLMRNGGWADSIDAIVVLIEKTLPGYDWRVGKCPIDGADKYDAQLYHEDDAKDTDADASSPALALCTAYCEARAAVEDAA